VPFTPVDQTIKQKIIAAYSANPEKSQNQILRELHDQGIKVSRGSVNNFVNAFKRKIQTSMPDGGDRHIPMSYNSISNDGHQSVSSETAVNNISDNINNMSIEPEIDFADTAYGFYPSLEVDVNNNSQKVINQPISTNLKDTTEEELRIIKAEQDSLEEDRMELDADKRAFEEETEAIRQKMRQKISSEKYLLKHETLLQQQKKKQLDERMRQVEQKEQTLLLKERDIVIREVKIMEAEPLLSLAWQFQSMGLNFDLLLPWIEYLREQVRRGVDSKTAAMYMVYEIKSHGELEGFRKQLDVAQAQLEKINTISAQKQRDLSILAELENKGVSLAVIYQLSRVIDLPKIAAELALRTDPWSNVSQSQVVNNGNNGYPDINNGYNSSSHVNKDTIDVNRKSTDVNNSETTNNGHEKSK
jgi:hypothetical protein